MNYASEISAVVQENAQNTINAVEAFGATITSYAAATNSTWPFVTIDDYPSRASRVAKLAGANSVVFLPLVQEEDRDEWVEYCQKEKPRFFKQAIDYEELDYTVDELVQNSSPDIFRPDWADLSKGIQAEDSRGPYLVWWQSFNLFLNKFLYTNLNLLSAPRAGNLFWTSSSTLVPSFEVATIPDPDKPGEYNVQSQLMQPVFEQIYDGKEGQERKVVGAIFIALDWIQYFQVRSFSRLLCSCTGHSINPSSVPAFPTMSYAT